MKAIELTRGMVALVDDEDFETLNQFEWQALFSKHGKCYYAVRSEWLAGQNRAKTIYMHRQILNAKPGQRVDHKSRASLDNRRENLRFCTHAQNMANSKLGHRNKSGFKGVFRNHGKWQAAIATKYIGLFNSPAEAANAYDLAAIAKYGQFACTNKSLGLTT